MLGIAAILAVMIVSLFIGLMSARGPFWRHSMPPPIWSRADELATGFSFVTGFLSIIALLAGMALYAVVLTTRMFFFNLHQPVWPSFKIRLFLASILVPLPIMLGVSGLVAALGRPCWSPWVWLTGPPSLS
jgi:hypothetical protein